VSLVTGDGIIPLSSFPRPSGLSRRTLSDFLEVHTPKSDKLSNQGFEAANPANNRRPCDRHQRCDEQIPHPLRHQPCADSGFPSQESGLGLLSVAIVRSNGESYRWVAFAQITSIEAKAPKNGE